MGTRTHAALETQSHLKRKRYPILTSTKTLLKYRDTTKIHMNVRGKRPGQGCPSLTRTAGHLLHVAAVEGRARQHTDAYTRPRESRVLGTKSTSGCL